MSSVKDTTRNPLRPSATSPKGGFKSQAARVSAERDKVKSEVLYYLGWTESKYAHYVQEMGLKYLNYSFGDDCPMIDELPKEKKFWGWWKIHWLNRDREFLGMVGMLHKHEMNEFYEDLHDPTRMPYKPHRDILEETYMYMIHDLIKDKVVVKTYDEILRPIIKEVAYEFGLPENFVWLKTRKKEISLPRMLFLYIALERHPELILKQLGNYVFIDHSSVIHSRDKIPDYLETEPQFRRHYQNIIKRLEDEGKTEG